MVVLMCALVFGSSMTVFAEPQIFDGVVFDPVYYAEKNPDVVACLGTDANLLFTHYVNFGINEGRAPFDPFVYINGSMADERPDYIIDAENVNKSAAVVPGVTPCLLGNTEVYYENDEQWAISDYLYEQLIYNIKSNAVGDTTYAMTEGDAWQAADLIRHACGANAGFPYDTSDWSANLDKLERNSTTQYTFYVTLTRKNKVAKSVIVLDLTPTMQVAQVWQLVAPKWVTKK